MNRSYKLVLQKDLFGELTLLQIWKGLHTDKGGHKYKTFDDLEGAYKEIDAISKRRESRGYRLVRE